MNIFSLGILLEIFLLFIFIFHEDLVMMFQGLKKNQKRGLICAVDIECSGSAYQ